MVETTADPICREALALGVAGVDPPEGAKRLASMAGDDRAALVAARDAFVWRLHHRSDDYSATAALSLLNRALSVFGWKDPYDWRGRLGNRLLKP